MVGGGPAGTSTAFGLARAGIAVTLVDRAHFPRAKACAESLSPQAARIFDLMQVLPDVERAGGAQLVGVRVRSPGGVEFEGRFEAGHGYRGFRDRGLSLPRRDLDAILLSAARRAGADVREGWRVTELLRDKSGRVRGVGGLDGDGRKARLSARVVVGADGLRSVVARELGLARRSRLPRRFAFVAHFTAVTGIGDHGEMHVARDGYVGLADVGQGRTSVALVVPAAVARAASHGAARFLKGWIDAQPQLAPRFVRATRISDVLTTGPFASHARRAWAPGAVLVGDAADFFDPFTGEGVYAALRGGELAMPFVAEATRAGDARAADRALATYARVQHREFRGKRIVEKLVGLAVASPLLLDQAARVLKRRRDMSDLLIGVTGDFVPASEVLRTRFLLALMRPVPR